MQISPTIRNVLAGFFLLLFAFCITPKRTLHNLLANHTDAQGNSKIKDPDQSQLTKAGYNCQVDNLITESPFVKDAHTHSLFVNPVFFFYQEKQSLFVDSSEFFCSGLRGPPAC